MSRWTQCSRYPRLLLRRRLWLLFVLLAGAAQAVAPIEVVGLFADRAVVQVAGGTPQLLKVGQTSSGGIELLSADAHKAVVRYRGEVHELVLSNRVSTGFQKVTKQTVSLTSDPRGQYHVRGAINSHYVNFLIDTGASIVALSSQAADRIGVTYQDGERGQVITAQGTTNSYFVTLDQVTVAGITAHNVRAAVIDGAYPVEILLGMSFLSQVAIAEQGGVMTLTQKF